MKKFNTLLGIAGIETPREKLDQWCNRNYEHLQDCFVLAALGSVVLYIIFK